MIAMQCATCLKVKNDTDFYKHKETRSGYLKDCRDCVKARVKAHRLTNRERIKMYDRQRSATAKGRQSRAESSRRYRAAKKATVNNRRWIGRNPEKHRAHTAVSNALKRGLLTKHPCEVCGDLKSQAHHDDYSKPLDVHWLCKIHHEARHHRRAI